MTLIVAQRHPDSRITLVADSKLSLPAEQLNPYLEGALKLLILRDSLCVGLAGPYDPDRVRELVALRQEPVERVLTKLEAWRRNDFIVASLEEGSRLFEVAGGSTQALDIDRAWIGHKDAYSAFQESFHAKGASGPDLT